MSKITEVAIIGAGPYGLSIAAHLHKLGSDYRIFGSPMRTWLTNMPRGMFLKSDGFASHLSDPDGQLTLDRFCREQQISYQSNLYETGWTPVHLETFINYGLSFQKRFVPDVEERTVVTIERLSDNFLVTFKDGETISARNVVVAVGIQYFQQMPAELSHLPPDYLSHSSYHSDLGRFSGRKVAVIGAGASAIELAALLHEIGADVHLIARRHSVDFQPVPLPRALWRRTLRPVSAIGYGWHSFLLSEAPTLSHFLPLDLRIHLVQRYLRPCAAWFLRDRVIGQIPMLLGSSSLRADVRDKKVCLRVISDDGVDNKLTLDHIVAATGYLPDVGRLTLLGAKVQTALRSLEREPQLSLNFESCVPGLYFVGPLSSKSFGPPMRFVHGAKYTARRLSKHLVRSISRKPLVSDQLSAQATKVFNARVD